MTFHGPVAYVLLAIIAAIALILVYLRRRGR